MNARRIPSLNWLRVFEAAARTESFAGAGRILNMSSAAVSQQIGALESHLKTKLFLRGPKNVSLTDAGHAFLPSVRQSLNTVELTAASIFGNTGEQAITVQASSIFALSWLAPRMNEFYDLYPDANVYLNFNDTMGEMNVTDATFSVTFGPVHKTSSESDHLFGEIVYPVASPKMAEKITSPDEMLIYSLIEVSSRSLNWFQLLEPHVNLDQANSSFRFVNSTVLAFALAGSDCGLALARAPATDQLMQNYGLSRLFPDVKMHGDEAYQLMHNTQSVKSKTAVKFREWLLDKASETREQLLGM